jgi:hypothetical protein
MSDPLNPLEPEPIRDPPSPESIRLKKAWKDKKYDGKQIAKNLGDYSKPNKDRHTHCASEEFMEK